MIKNLNVLIRNFCPIVSGQLLDLLKVEFEQTAFENFLSEKYKIVRVPMVFFGSSPFRWVLGSFYLRSNKIFLFWPGIINQAQQKGDNISKCLAKVLAHETKHLLQGRSLAGGIWQTFQYLFWYSLIAITGLYFVSANFLFFPLNLIFWCFSFLVYFILPCEISARQFVKKEMAENSDQWLKFFKI